MNAFNTIKLKPIMHILMIIKSYYSLLENRKKLIIYYKNYA